MKYTIVVLLVLLLAAIITPASAQPASIPPISGKYTLKATSPSDDPATPAIEVKAGEAITVSATASIRYDGDLILTPPIRVKTELRLYDDSADVAVAADQHVIRPMLLEKAKTYEKTGSGLIVVPAKTVPGTYQLEAIATACTGFLGFKYERSANEEFVVIVSGPETEKAPAPVEKSWFKNFFGLG